MRLINMPTMPSPAARAMPGRETPADALGALGAFGELLDRDTPARRMDAKVVSKEPLDETALPVEDEPDMEVVGSFAVAAPDEHLTERRDRPANDGHAPDPRAGVEAADARLQPPGRARIDWLALRIPKGDEAPAADSGELKIENAVAIPAPVDAAENATAISQEATEAAPDVRLAAAVARREERIPDERVSAERERPSMRGNAEEAPARASAPVADAKPSEPAPRETGARDGSAEPASDQLLVPQRVGEQSEAGTGDRPMRPVSTVSVQTVPAFAATLQGPAQTVLDAVGEQAPEIARSADAAATQPHTAAQPMRVLKIQLHPLELGMVTARLSLQGGEMSVELQAETRDAAAKLQADSNEIAKALRGLGIEIDRVTVTQQPSTSTQSQDQQGQQAASERSGERFANEGGASGRQNGRNGAGSGTGSFEGERNAGDSQGSRGVYI
ncbi:flagellar hook-length control protein FliK [Aliihoeflea sp. 40Bstr573]|uniref:flagellar hook-length control protein FliK n=1 Tax=Aliihoeflea sp. 40Bstr573 TaxID=2696467 RepID=UPI0020943B45|nr:flagellar hook-length control protein FliK [Aliihoeflea sp. 40Bstr573]MCO6386596.1 hypothetical protein [Aliihoeflea sp. 40Bstr573]